MYIRNSYLSRQRLYLLLRQITVRFQIVDIVHDPDIQIFLRIRYTMTRHPFPKKYIIGILLKLLRVQCIHIVEKF